MADHLLKVVVGIVQRWRWLPVNFLRSPEGQWVTDEWTALPEA
jgi:hypothetical protein